MGCCVSRPAGPNSPYPGGGRNNSARAINSPAQTQVPNDAAALSPENAEHDPSSPSTRERRRRHSQRPLEQHINKPLRPHQWRSKDRLWTRRRLDRERHDFFDTRVTGRPEVWQTLHAALQVMWDPDTTDGSDGDGIGGLATAQTILDAAEISLPTGDLAQGAYDSLGNYYPLPEWAVCDPANLVDEDDQSGAKRDASLAMDDTAAADDDDDDERAMMRDEAQQRREEKGKEVADVREQVSLRARLSDSGRDIQIYVGLSESARSVARRVAEESGLSTDKKVRLAYMGRILKDTTSLEAQGWQTGHVVNALVFNR